MLWETTICMPVIIIKIIIATSSFTDYFHVPGTRLSAFYLSYYHSPWGLAPFYIGSNGDTERLSELPKVTQQRVEKVLEPR